VVCRRAPELYFATSKLTNRRSIYRRSYRKDDDGDKETLHFVDRLVLLELVLREWDVARLLSHAGGKGAK
jgi:hypothetical protein